MDISQLETILRDQPKFRLNQAKFAVFQELIEDWNEVTSLPIELRNQLIAEAPLSINAKVLESYGRNAVKICLTLEDRLAIESVLMRHKDGRNTVCVSSQGGCPLACEFCATGKMGFKRNLGFEEIIEQVLFFARYLKPETQRITNIVFMGMGEPFLNYDNVMSAIRMINDKKCFNIGARSISISTAGIVEGIDKLADEPLQVNLAISLHAPNDDLRTKIMPIAKKYPLAVLFDSVDQYIRRTKRKVMFEYLLIKDVNDSDECAEELARLMQKPLYFLNLIMYNPTGTFKPSTSGRVERFKAVLSRRKVNFSQRYSFGGEIKAACGQFGL